MHKKFWENIAEVNAKDTHFVMAKASAIACCKGEFWNDL